MGQKIKKKISILAVKKEEPLSFAVFQEFRELLNEPNFFQSLPLLKKYEILDRLCSPVFRGLQDSIWNNCQEVLKLFGLLGYDGVEIQTWKIILVCVTVGFR